MVRTIGTGIISDFAVKREEGERERRRTRERGKGERETKRGGRRRTRDRKGREKENEREKKNDRGGEREQETEREKVDRTENYGWMCKRDREKKRVRKGVLEILTRVCNKFLAKVLQSATE